MGSGSGRKPGRKWSKWVAFSNELKKGRRKRLALNDINNELDEKEIDSWIRLTRVLTHEIMNAVTPVLEDGKSVRSIDFSDDEQKIVKGLFLLTSKPVLYVANIAEEDMADPDSNKYMDAIKEHVKDDGEVIGVAAAAEEQIAEMDEADKADFLEMEGVTEPGLNRLIRAAYKLLGLETFFTAGGPETRAWTYKKGTKAPQAAGIIHSDFERGFIRAEVMSFEDLDELGSESAVKEAGKLRLEGKDYVMQDGDIVEFRFNV